MTDAKLAAFVTAFVAVLAVGLVPAHAAWSRAQVDTSAAEAIGALVGNADLVLSTQSRWLRHPSWSEAHAAVADAPTGMDVDPAGAWVAAPRTDAPRAASGRGDVPLFVPLPADEGAP